MSDADLSQYRWETRIASNALCRGPIDTRVEAVPGQAARFGKAHIVVRFGGLLFYLEDRAALDALSAAVTKANGFAEAVFGPVEDAFTVAERRTNRRYERGISRRYP